MTDTQRSHQETLVTVTIDGTKIAAEPGELVIEAAERAGIFIPRFCYHPRMEPVGMCRMCLVEVSSPRGFSLQPACYIRVGADQEVLTTSEKARKAQEGVLEFLLVNHPLDCPVCDKGGECPLQDQALSHGPGESRFIEDKRHFEKPIEIGPLIALDRERCIQCARCTRFADEVAGEALIDFAFRGDEIEVAPFPSVPFSSYFSGNTVQICPVGALTALPYRFKSRPWDLEQVESTCTTCAVGCRVAAQSSQGRLVRYLGVDSDPVNQSWLCDKGRFGYEAVHAPNRITTPLIRRDGELTECSWNDALSEVVTALSGAIDDKGASSVGVIGGSHLTNEDAYAFAKFSKAVIGTDSVDAQLGDGLPAATVLSLPRATIDDATKAEMLIVLSGDLREELPVLFLRLRAAARSGLSILECSPKRTELSRLGGMHLSYLPGEAARLVEALGSAGPAELVGCEPAELEQGRALFARSAHDEGAGVVVAIGRPSIAESEEIVAGAAAALQRMLPKAKFLLSLRRANVNGALDMGLAPGYLPGRVNLSDGRSIFSDEWETIPDQRGRDTRAILESTRDGEMSVLVLLGADPVGDFPDSTLASQALAASPFTVFLGTHHDRSSELADVVLPLSGDGERFGSTTNIEGRITRLAQKVVPPGVAWAPWVVAVDLARRLGADLGFDGIEAITDEIARLAPSHRGLNSLVLSDARHKDGLVAPLSSVAVSLARPRRIDPMATPGITSTDEQGSPLRVGSATSQGGESDLGVTGLANTESSLTPRLAPEFKESTVSRLDSYSHRLFVSRTLYDGSTAVVSSPSLQPLVPEEVLFVHPFELDRLGVKSGGKVRVRSARAEFVFTAKSDDTLLRQVVGLFSNLGEGGRATKLIDSASLVTDVRLESVDG